MKLTEEQVMIRDLARDFARSHLAPKAAARDADGTFPAEELALMGELGFLGMLVPEAHGGVGADHVTYTLALEEIAAGEGATSTIMSVHNSVVCVPVLRYGSEWHHEMILPTLASGEMLGAFALTEPQAGSDASALTTRAERISHGYRLNGTKQFITSGQNANYTITFAVTDPGAGKHGLTAFIVPTEIEGYQVTSVEKKMGQRASDTCQIVFDNLEIPEQYRLGEEGEGYRIALSNLEGGRIGIASQAVGMARAAFEHALDYANTRTAFGKTLVEQQSIAFRLADMATQIDAARLLVQRAATLRDAGEPCLREASMCKLFASEMAESVCSSAIQIHGGYGYLSDFPVERIARDVRVCQIYEGTSEIQRLVISRNLDGLYR